MTTDTPAQRAVSLHAQLRAIRHCRVHHATARHGQVQGLQRRQSSGRQVHPYALELLRQLNYDTSGLRTKSWEEFAGPGAPELDFVFTVCDDAANEVCPSGPASR